MKTKEVLRIKCISRYNLSKIDFVPQGLFIREKFLLSLFFASHTKILMRLAWSLERETVSLFLHSLQREKEAARKSKIDLNVTRRKRDYSIQNTVFQNTKHHKFCNGNWMKAGLLRFQSKERNKELSDICKFHVRLKGNDAEVHSLSVNLVWFNLWFLNNL